MFGIILIYILSDDLDPNPYTSPSLPTLLLDSDICPDGTKQDPNNIRKNTHSDADRIQAAIDTREERGGTGPAKISKYFTARGKDFINIIRAEKKDYDRERLWKPYHTRIQCLVHQCQGKVLGC